MSPSASWSQRTFASLSRPAYRRFFVGNVTTLMGFWVRIIAQGWLVYAITGSKALLGAVTAAGLLPFVFLSPWGGVLADRVDRRRLLIAAELVAAAVNVTLGGLILAGVVTILHVFVAAVVVGTTRAIGIPVRNAFVRDLVGIESLPNAVALNAAGFNVARVVGPALGGVLLAVLGMGPAFLAVAVGNLGFVVALLGLAGRHGDTRPAAAGGALRQLLEGLHYVRHHRRTRTLLLLLSISLVSTWAYQTLMPAFARDTLGLGESGFGLLMSVAGAGALLGALWVAGRTGTLPGRRNVVFGLLTAGSICVLMLSRVTSVAAAVPLLFGAGFCQVAFMATGNGMVQESVPDALRGRVMGLWAFTFGASFPLGSLAMGGLAEAFGLDVAWAAGPVVTIVLCTAVRLRMPPRPSRATSEAGAADADGDGGPAPLP